MSSTIHSGYFAPLAIIKHRFLLHQLIRRDVLGRYKGSWLGLLWSFFNPLLMLFVYTFFFTVVFKAKWGTDASGNRAEFAIFAFVGILVHGLAAECINRAPGLITGHQNYVKKVVFPLEILPMVSLGTALFHCGVSVVVLTLVQIMLGAPLHFTAFLFPLVLLPLVLLILGVSWFLASLGVFIRDVGQVTGLVMTILLFISPVFFPVSAMPEGFRKWLEFNPLAAVIENARAVLLMGVVPDPRQWAFACLISLGVAWLGFWWFEKTKRGFADVL
ncbi:ABC transporter permease [Solilutibacter silvestris]|uniref:ABC transporter permease n=1 Tax=Solilutibacter silvestris TaxID=1645665 RepID=UPI003D3455A6